MIGYLWDTLGAWTVLGVIAALVSMLVVIGFLHERDSVEAIARSRPRRFAILATGVGFFVCVGLGLQDVPGAIGLCFWFLAATVLLGAFHVIKSPVETLFPIETYDHPDDPDDQNT